MSRPDSLLTSAPAGDASGPIPAPVFSSLWGRLAVENYADAIRTAQEIAGGSTDPRVMRLTRALAELNRAAFQHGRAQALDEASAALGVL